MGPGNTPYCTRVDLQLYIPPAALSLVQDSVIDQLCLDATNAADDFMRGRYQMPLLEWSTSIRQHTAYIALYYLANRTGWAPQAGSDENITKNYYIATGWPDRPGTGFFPGIQRQAIHPDVTPSIAPGTDPIHDMPQVSTQQKRGWYQFSRSGKPVI